MSSSARFQLDAERIFFATSHGKSPCDGGGGFVKRFAVKHSLQRPLHDQILSYQSMLDLCVREIPSNTFLMQVRRKWPMFVLTWRITLQGQKPCLKQGLATILYQYLPTKLLIN